MKKKIGFIGLGQMGRWMALNLLKGDFDITVFDISKDAMAFLTAKGAKKAESPAELARQTDWIFLSLPNSNVAEQVVFGQEGILCGSKKNQILVDLGTSNYMWTKEFSDRLKENGICFSDAPVTGMEDRAKQASLTIMFGGDKEILKEISPAFDKIGNEVVHMGDVGSGQLSKMINNVLFNVHLAALAEVLPMAAELGLEPEKVAQVINTGSGQSFASKVFIPKILDNCFDHGYPMKHAYKDMVNVCEISSHEKIPIPVVYAAFSTYQTALKSGYGEEDKGSMIKIFEKLLKIKFRGKKN
ncbi:NAD(P)-dependent oxidoreductase [Desulfobacula sp.]|uniref:NAD(P)-dependent oxidoreductase n=1 Tax=Desulfobacula sp. TaxID=2593537 RepID=UPI0026121A18|nr:NAD(P)-dependent oxidoreductase [Desulfobacula sp.]